MKQSWVEAPDGARIEVRSAGAGPGLVLLHGGSVNSGDYGRLIEGLAQGLTVHAYDRRGYGGLPLAPGAPVLATHLGDLAAVLEATGSTRVFGHSGGAFYALQAALTLPVEAVAVYDPALAVDGLFPTAFVEPFGAAIEAGDFVTALLEMGRGIGAAGPGASHLPVPVQRFAIRMFLRTRIGAHLASLLPATLPDVRAIAAAEGPASDYSAITARTLLSCGTAGPAYYGPICDRLAAVIPAGRSLRISKASHNSANIARPAFVAPFIEFFAAG